MLAPQRMARGGFAKKWRKGIGQKPQQRLTSGRTGVAGRQHEKDEAREGGQGQIMAASYAMLRNLDLDLDFKMVVSHWRIHWEGTGGGKKTSSGCVLRGILLPGKDPFPTLLSSGPRS